MGAWRCFSPFVIKRIQLHGRKISQWVSELEKTGPFIIFLTIRIFLNKAILIIGHCYYDQVYFYMNNWQHYFGENYFAIKSRKLFLPTWVFVLQYLKQIFNKGPRTEAATAGVPWKKVFSNILPVTCVGVSF